eukprot:COSAG05_NODE_302_length_11841_cov_253.738801_13_plen_45_part_00
MSGKHGAREIKGFGGAMVFELDYDTMANNNTLYTWVAAGLREVE